jgi:hypothetical protein
MKRRIVQDDESTITHDFDGMTLSKLLEWVNQKIEDHKEDPKEPVISLEWEEEGKNLTMTSYRYETDKEWQSRTKKENRDKAQETRRRILAEKHDLELYEKLKKKFEGKKDG